MTITIASPLTEEEFTRRLKQLLIQLERKDLKPYADTHNPTHPTIGIGFDLTQLAIRSQVYAAMGITAGSTTATSLTNAILAAQGKTTAAIQTDLDKAYGKSFVMTDAQIDTAFAQIAKPYIDTAKN